MSHEDSLCLMNEPLKVYREEAQDLLIGSTPPTALSIPAEEDELQVKNVTL